MIIYETLHNQGQQLYKMARPTAVLKWPVVNRFNSDNSVCTLAINDYS